MTDIKERFKEIDDQVMGAFRRPSWKYVAVIVFCLLLCLAGFCVFWYQYTVGMGTTGLSIPVGWAVYISNYIFWIAVAMSGTFISAMLYIFRTNWRSAVNRTAETMTVVGIAIAGLFPIIHLGRNWVFYWVLPYPNWRHLWPNFKSPLVWDAIVILVYFVASVIIWYVGMLPDLAMARDKTPKGWRKTFYSFLAMGWTGRYNQWRQYTPAYLVFAVTAMPLAMSVHSVTSWDLSMALLPGWHSTFYAPYFIIAAILSGLATIISLLVPLRKILRLEDLFKPVYIRQMSLIMVLMAWLLGYYYGMEAFLDWYTGEPVHRQFSYFRGLGSGYYSSIWWIYVVFNVFLPMTFLFRKLRNNLWYLFGASIFINIGLWLERYLMVIGSLSHTYMPSDWGVYAPRVPESLITAFAFAFLVAAFLILIKFLPPVAVAEVKKEAIKEREGG